MAVEITEEFVWQSIPRRARDSHKGTFGSVLAVAGSAFYRGAALLAAGGALRTGAGIVGWRWRAVPFTGARPCWQPRVHSAPGRASSPLQA